MGIAREQMDTRYNMIIINDEIKTSDIFSCVYNDYTKKMDIKFIKNEETGEKLLTKRYENISFVSDDVALAKYLNPSAVNDSKKGYNYIPIFPFGCNNSQYKAVKNAMENQISVIQGPPGTGKTQTILNIIANILMLGKTVQIVSNNNSATENVYEKLSSPKYNLGFIAATLGSVFDKQEKLACLKQELSQLLTEKEYFNQYIEKLNISIKNINFKKKLSSKNWMNLWQECQLILEDKKVIGLWFKIKAFF